MTAGTSSRVCRDRSPRAPREVRPHPGRISGRPRGDGCPHAEREDHNPGPTLRGASTTKRPRTRAHMKPSFPTLDRREALLSLGGGFGSLVLAHLLATDASADSPRPEFNGGLHHPAKARRVIQLFMNGGASQMDTFDYKPTLQKRHGQSFDPGGGQRVEAVTSVPGKVLGCPFPFRQHGQSGRWVSGVFEP